MSISSRIQSIAEHLEKDWDSIEAIGGEAEDKNIENIASALEQIYEEMPKVEATGTSVSLSPTRKGKIKIVLMPSELEQETTSGKNMLNVLDYISTTANATFTNDIIRVYSTRVNTSPFIDYVYSVQENDIIRLNGIIQSSQGRFVLQTSMDGTNYSTVSTATRNYIDGTTISSFEYTIPAGVTYIRVLLYSDKGVTTGDSESYYKNVIITINNSDMIYEPYTGGQPSPSSDFPQDIHVVNRDNTITISNSDNTQSQAYLISLGDLEYCKIDDYEDLFFKNVAGSTYYDSTLVENKWYLKKNIGKTTDIIGSTSKTISDMVSNATVYSYCGGTVSGATITYSKTLTVANYIYYPTTIPTNILLNNTLQTQLDNIQKAISYQGQTNVSQTNDDLPFIIKLSAIRDLSGIFDLIQE